MASIDARADRSRRLHQPDAITPSTQDVSFQTIARIVLPGT